MKFMTPHYSHHYTGKQVYYCKLGGGDEDQLGYFCTCGRAYGWLIVGEHTNEIYKKIYDSPLQIL